MDIDEIWRWDMEIDISPIKTILNKHSVYLNQNTLPNKVPSMCHLKITPLAICHSHFEVTSGSCIEKKALQIMILISSNN